MEFQILGPIDARTEDGAVALGGNKPRAVLAVLLLHANEPVSAERLALALWGEDAPGSAVKTVQVHVSRLRKALGDPDIVATTAAGYRLRVRPGELDAQRFERLVEDGRRALAAGQPEHASEVLRSALALWRGPPLAELAAEPFAAAEIARLEEQRLAALEARVEADLAGGRHDQLVGELQQLVADNPIRERLAGQLMLALYRCGRQSEALETFAETRRTLVSDVGVEPGPELRRLQDAILRQDVSLERQAQQPDLPAELDAAAAPPLVARRDELSWLRERWERARTKAGTLAAIVGEPGIGKTRLASELAGECRQLGATVLYVAGTDRVGLALAALQRAREAAAPTLLVVEHVDRADAQVLARLEGLPDELARAPVLVLATAADGAALGWLAADDVLALGPLDAQAVGEIAAGYAPGLVADDVPARSLLQTSGGIPRRVHQAAGQWARREAARRVGAVADRAAAGRAELRSIEAELTGDVVELQAAGERVQAPGDDDAPVICPFKGLASFDLADAPYFFGRERLIAELVARLVGAPLLAVVGPSGSGKSSVTKAGLLPALADGVLPGSDRWTQVLIRPGEHPLRELRDATSGLDSDRQLVIAVDQFEETFTTCRDEEERAAFIAELVGAAEDRRQQTVVVIALRADFYGRCAAYPGLSELVATNHVLVGAMRRDELRRAIERPAQRVGLIVDPELADALVADVKDEPGALPLLSTALLELWQRRDGRRLRYVTYEQTGGVRGAVARLAEDAFGQLDEKQQKVARSVLMRLAGEGAAGAVERRRVALAELETERNEDVARVVALLTDRRLLTVSEGTIEFAHEALLREWPRLRGWIDEDRDGLRIQRSLSAGAHEWERLGRDDGALYRGVRLTEATEWSEAQQPRLNETERAFLAAGQAARQRDRATRRRRIVLAFGSLAVALAAISIVAVVSIVQGRKTASRELANRSAAVLAGDPALALAIGREAVKRHDTPEAQNAVRQATLAERATAIIHAHQVAAYTAALSPDGSRVATAGDDGLVRISKLDGARVTSTIKGHEGPALYAGFSPNGRQVASVGVDGEVAIADLDGRRRHVVLRLGGDPGPYARSVEYGADGRRLLIAVSDGSVRLVSVAGARVSTFARHDGVDVARLDTAGGRVLTAGEDGYARLWDLAGIQTGSLPHGKVDIFDASFSPDGRRVATAAGDGVLRIWSVASGVLLQTLALDLQPLYSVRFSSDGRRIVTAGGDGVVRVSDVRGGPVLAELKGHRDRAYDAGFVRGDDSVYSAGKDGTVRTWALPKTATLPVREPDNTPFTPAFSPDGKLVLSGDAYGEVRLWSPATDTLSKLPGHLSDSAALYSGNGAYILSSSASARGQDARVRLYDVKRRTSSVARVRVAEEINAAAIDPTGRRIATAGLAKPAVIQAPDGNDRVVLPDHEQVNRLEFSPDGKHLLSASDDGTVRTWNAATGASERVLKGIEGAVLWATYGPDGQRVAAAGADGTVRVWPLDGGDPVVLFGHEGPVNTVAFNPAGNRLVSGGKDGSVRVWDSGGGPTLVVLNTHEGEVTGVAFSPSGQSVVSGADDGLRVSACEVCGAFSDVLALAKSRPDVELSADDRARLVQGK